MVWCGAVRHGFYSGGFGVLPEPSVFFRSISFMKTKIVSVEYGPRVLTNSGIVWAFVTFTVEREDGQTWNFTRYGLKE